VTVAELAQEAAPSKPLPSVSDLAPLQLEGINCARCGEHLDVDWRAWVTILYQPAQPCYQPCAYSLYVHASCYPKTPLSLAARLPRWVPPEEDPKPLPECDDSEATLRRVRDALHRLPDACATPRPDRALDPLPPGVAGPRYPGAAGSPPPAPPVTTPGAGTTNPLPVRRRQPPSP
jgi:hypothetical protein